MPPTRYKEVLVPYDETEAYWASLGHAVPHRKRLVRVVDEKPPAQAPQLPRDIERPRPVLPDTWPCGCSGHLKPDNTYIFTKRCKLGPLCDVG